jgi:hypothetical protein
VQSSSQAVRLAQRALLRLNPKRAGTVITTLYGLRYAGERWIKLQFPPFPGLEDCVIEVQDFQADILGGTVTIKFITINPLLPENDLLREDGTLLLREDGTAYLREASV